MTNAGSRDDDEVCSKKCMDGFECVFTDDGDMECQSMSTDQSIHILVQILHMYMHTLRGRRV